MPTLATFFGIQIRMYWSDTDRHKAPHFHALYGEYKAAFSLNGELMRGKFPRKQKMLVKAWVLEHEDELAENWLLATTCKQAFKIKPLR